MRQRCACWKSMTRDLISISIHRPITSVRKGSSGSSTLELAGVSRESVCPNRVPIVRAAPAEGRCVSPGDLVAFEFASIDIRGFLAIETAPFHFKVNVVVFERASMNIDFAPVGGELSRELRAFQFQRDSRVEGALAERHRPFPKALDAAPPPRVPVIIFTRRTRCDCSFNGSAIEFAAIVRRDLFSKVIANDIKTDFSVLKNNSRQRRFRTRTKA